MMRQIFLRLAALGMLCLSLSACVLLDTVTFRDYYVAVTGNDASGDGSNAKPWRHIAYALNHIDYTGDPARLNVLAGVYDEQLTITKPVFIRGAGSDQVRLLNSASNQPVVEIQGPGLSARLESLTIDGSNAANLGIKVIKAGFKLANVTVYRPGVYGIWIENSPLFALRDVTVTTDGMIYVDVAINIQDSRGVVTNFIAGDHIDHVINILGGDSSVDIVNAQITGSPIWYADGIRIQSAARVRIADSHISRPLDAEVPGPGQVHNPPYAGIEVAGSANWGKTISIENCQISGFDVGIGINLVGNTVLLSDTHIASAAHSAVDIYWNGSGAFPFIDLGSILNATGNNTFHASSPYAVKLRGPFHVQAHYNNWDVPAALIDSRIHDKNDDPSLGTVFH